MRIKYLSILPLCLTAFLSLNSISVAQSSNPDFGRDTIEDQNYIQDFPITPITLPAVASGIGTISYSINPTLPDGLTFTGNNRILTGTPRIASPTTEFTYTASNTEGHVDSLSFSITVEEDTQPVAPTLTKIVVIGNTSFSSTRYLDSFTGGNGDLTYSLSSTPRLPEGVSFNPRTLMITGEFIDTAENQNSDTTYTYTATDEDGDTASSTFTLRILDYLPVPRHVRDFEIVIGKPVTMGGLGSRAMFNIPRFYYDLDGVYEYRGLPPGLNSWGNLVTGTPTALGSYKVTYTNTNSLGESASTTFTIKVVEEIPIGPPTRQQSFSFSVGEVVDQTLDAFTGGNSRLTYRTPSTISASYFPHIDLIRGLKYSPLGRNIYGTVTAGPPEVITRTFTYIAMDSLYGHTASATFTISIGNFRPVAPKVSNFVFTPLEEVDATLPEFTGEDGVLTYSLTDGINPVTTLIGGLTYDPQTRTISGTVPGTSGDDSVPATTYTYSATDEDGDTASTTFTISIVDARPDFGLARIADMVGTPGTSITVTLPAVTSAGNGETTYSFEQPLSWKIIHHRPHCLAVYCTHRFFPGNWRFDSSTRVLEETFHSGSPTLASGTVVQATYSATDADGDKASIVFYVFVEFPLAPPILQDFVFEPGESVSATLPPFTGGKALSPAPPSLPRPPPPSPPPHSRPFPPFTGGDGALTHSLTDGVNSVTSLVGGLTYDPQTRTISGTTPSTSGDDSVPATTYTYSATDGDGDTASTTFTITIADAMPAFASDASIDNIIGTQGTAITPITLPRLSMGGTRTNTYSLIPQLPVGLSFEQSTRMLSGTPDNVMPETAYTYLATDIDGDTANIEFTITVEAQVPQDDVVPVAPTISNFVFTPLEEVDTTLPPFTGGDGALTYALLPSLPVGLAFNASTRTISGTVVGTSGDDSVPATSYTYSATDEDGDEASTTFTITMVDSMPVAPSFSQVFTFTTEDAVNQVLAAFTNGNGVLTYALSSTPSLPSGLSFDANSRVISGTVANTTADDSVPATTYTYSATDADGDEATATFTIEVEDSITVITVIPPSTSTYSFILGKEITPIILPDFTSSPGLTLTYSVEGLPTGLTFTAATRMLTGTPTQAGVTTFTYIATLENGSGARTTLTIEVIEFYFTAPKISDFVFTPLEEVDTTLPPFTGGDGALTYALLPSLPVGLAFNASTRTISGTVPGTSEDDSVPATTYTYSATDEDGDTESAIFTITIVDSIPVAPSFSQVFTFTTEDAVNQVLAAFTNGNGALTYALSSTPSLPSGLSFDANSRVISGTVANTAADDSVPATTYTYSATDADGDEATATFTIEVEDSITVITVIPPSTSTYSFILGKEITPIILPDFTSSPGLTLTYSVEGLPTGLTFTAATRMLTGTPTQAGVTTFTYIATLENGSGARTTLTIEVIEFYFTAPTISDFVFTPLEEVDTTLPPFTGGDGALTYALLPSLPVGLAFNASTRTISGTVPGTSGDDSVPATAYTYTATDEDGDTESAIFTITIVDSIPVAPSFSQVFTFTTEDAVNQVLAAFTNGNGALTYALSSTPSLPSGLSFDANSRVISGTVANTAADDSVPATTYTYSATDADGDEATATFTIEVEDSITVITVIPPSTSTYSFILGKEITPIILPDFTSSPGLTLTYSVEGLPTGLTFTAATRMLTGTPTQAGVTTFTYIATLENGSGARTTLTIEVIEFYFTAPTVPNYTFDQDVPLKDITLPSFTSTSGQPLSHTLAPLPNGLTFDKDTRVLVGTPTVAGTTTVTYTASDENGEQESVVFTISVIEFYFTAPAIEGYKFTLNNPLDPITLPSFSSTSGQPLSYTLAPLPRGLNFNEVTRVLAGTPIEAGNTRVRYTATDPNGSYAATEFPIVVVDVVALETATTGALPSVGANVALVATEAISTRVGLALDGQSQGLDIRTPSGQQFKLGVNGANAQSSSTASAIRFGAWYSTSHDELSNTQTDLSWSGITDSTNVGIDIGFDLSSKASLVFGVMQNASTTSATYANGDGTGAGLLDVDLDATTFYVGFGYDWLDVWFANGSASSMLNDSASTEAIPTSFAYQTVGLTAAFDFTGGFQVGAKVESLTSALSLSSREALNYAGLESDSSQFRTAFFVNYKLDLGKQGNAQFIPKFEMGYRGLTQNSNSSAAAASAGTAAETSFGVDYLQKQLNLTIGFSIRSFEVQNYASESTQWHIRWESSTYDKGLSLQLRPTVVGESLGLDALYNSDYSQYQSLLSRQYGGDTGADDDGLDFEMGYGITSGGGTYTPFVKTTNFVFGQAANNSRRTQEIGIRYTTPSGLDLTLAMERLYNPVSSFSSQSAFGATPVLMQRENSLEFSTRYNF